MRDELDPALQDWFKRSTEALPEQPFALTVQERIWRHELSRRLQRYAALLVGAFSFWLLLPQIGRVAARLLTMADGVLEQALLLVIAAGVVAYALALRRVRR